jgi:hypothetical protein
MARHARQLQSSHSLHIRPAYSQGKIIVYAVDDILRLCQQISLDNFYSFVNFLFPFDYGLFGGFNFRNSLEYLDFNANGQGDFDYIIASNLLSYVVQARTEMTPEQFAMVEVFPLLGIKPSDCLWYKNLVGVSYAFHGLLMNTNAMAKLGQLYLQGGLAKENERIVSQDWVDESTSEVEPGSGYGYLWWVEHYSIYFAGGMGDQIIGVNERRQ